MTDRNSNGEQSMEDILASIRRIISEDDDETQQPEPQLNGTQPFNNGPTVNNGPSGAAQHAPDSARGATRAPDSARDATYTAESNGEPQSDAFARLMATSTDTTYRPAGHDDPEPDLAPRVALAEAKPLSALIGDASLDVADADPAPLRRFVASTDLPGTARANPPIAEPDDSARRDERDAQPMQSSPFTAADQGPASAETVTPAPAATPMNNGEAARFAAAPAAAAPVQPTQSIRSDDQGTSALERLQATMPTLKRPNPSEAREIDNTPLPPAMRDFSGAFSSSNTDDDGDDLSDAESTPEPAAAPHAEDPGARGQSEDVTSREQPQNAPTEPAIDAQPEADATPAASGSALAVVPSRTSEVKPVSETQTSSSVATGGVRDRGDDVVTLEDTVADMLRPMLRQWLDDNMPRIVARVMAEESRGETGKSDRDG
ncbi:MAG: DUF2497 domain-containing protein [Pseudomonadota bacterium]